MTIAQSVSPLEEKERTRHLILLLSVWSLAISLIVRGYIFAEAPLPPTRPLPWFFGALAEDAAVLSAIAILCLLAPRQRIAQIIARFVFGISAIAITALEVVRGEAVIFFGEAVRPEDLHEDVRVTVLLRSVSGPAAALLILAALTLPFVFWLWELRQRPRGIRIIRAAVLAVIVSGGAIIGLLTEYFVHGAGLARNPIVALFMIEREMRVAPATLFEHAKPQMPITSIRDFIPSGMPRTYLDPQYPLAYLPGLVPMPIDVPPGVKPNIVLFVMESLRAGAVGCYGAEPSTLTPNLDALARDGIRVEDMYCSGTYTASAELALWYGLPPTPREILITSRPRVDIVGLPEILRSTGWKTMMWLHGGDLDFYRRDMFYLPRGFHVVDARSFPRDDPSTNWGYSDRALVRHSVTALTRAKEPFAAMVLTVTNHHMFQLPTDAEPRVLLPPHQSDQKHARVDDMLQTVHYTDVAVGDFMREARAKPWFKRTIFVFTGDHGLTMPPFGRAIETEQQEFNLLHRVPLIIYSPMITHPAVLHGPASQVDVMPTVLSLAGVDVPRSGIGANLFALKNVHDRLVPVWGAHNRSISLVGENFVYHAQYGSDLPFISQTPDETLYDVRNDPNGYNNILNELPKAKLERFRHLRDVYLTVYPWLVVNGRSGTPPPPAAR
jgi:phosphoglycerol transferase MdoB-like AlkP superfamily enzyme